MDKAIFKEQFPRHVNYYESLDSLVRLVEEMSKHVNITSIRDYEDIWQKHIIDSLMATRVSVVEGILSKEGSKVLDVGTGGGFPGLPLAITHPTAQFTLLEATRKKVDVVEEFASELKLKNVQTIWGRAEEVTGDTEHFESYDIVTARSVAYLPELITLVVPFMKDDGLIVLYKGVSAKEKGEGLLVANKLGLKLGDEYFYSLGDSLDDLNDRVIYFATTNKESPVGRARMK